MIKYQSVARVLRTVRRTLLVWSALSVAYFLIALMEDAPFTDSLLLWSVMILALVPPSYILLGIFYKMLSDKWITLKNPDIILVVSWIHCLWMLMCITLGPMGVKMPGLFG